MRNGGKMEEKITFKQHAIFEFIKTYAGFVSPTEIGLKLYNYPYEQASSYVSPQLKKLTNLGLIERNKKGQYRFKKLYIAPKENKDNFYRQKIKKCPWYKHLISLRSRCSYTKCKYYKKGIKSFLTEEDIKELWFRDKAYLLKQPSIDRKDNNGHYIKDNCQFIEFVENSRKGGIYGRHKYLSSLQ